VIADVKSVLVATNNIRPLKGETVFRIEDLIRKRAEVHILPIMIFFSADSGALHGYWQKEGPNFYWLHMKMYN